LRARCGAACADWAGLTRPIRMATHAQTDALNRNPRKLGARLVDSAAGKCRCTTSQIEEHHVCRRRRRIRRIAHAGAGHYGPGRGNLFAPRARERRRQTDAHRAPLRLPAQRTGPRPDDLIVYLIGDNHTGSRQRRHRERDWRGSRRCGRANPERRYRPAAELCMLAVQGPMRARAPAGAPETRAGTAVLAVFRRRSAASSSSRARLHREDGFELMFPQSGRARVEALTRAGAAPAAWAPATRCGSRRNEPLRQDMDDTVTPANRDSHGRWIFGANAILSAGRRSSTRTPSANWSAWSAGRGVLRAHQRVVTSLGEAGHERRFAHARARSPSPACRTPFRPGWVQSKSASGCSARVVKPPLCATALF